jgi:hypothetical protein
MNKQFESPMSANENTQMSQIKKIEDFSKEHNIDSKDLFTAYEMALDSSFEEETSKNSIREEVKNLAKMMDDFMKDGLTLNRIKKLIDSRSEYDSACKNYYAMVNGMQINDKGKRMLASIVEKKRTGTLMISDAQTAEELGEINIPKDVEKDEHSQNDLAVELIQCLSRYKDQKIEIMFSE